MQLMQFSRQVVCPGCGGPSLYAPSNPFRPFCCERCKKIDLGVWAEEGFRLPTDATPDEFLEAKDETFRA